MHTYLYSANQTRITWNKACRFNENKSINPISQYFSVWNTAGFVKATIPSTPLSCLSIQVLSIGSSALASCTNQSHNLEKLVQITQIAMTAYTIIFGNNKKRAAILCIAIIVIANRAGLIPQKLARLSNRYSYLLSSVSTATAFKSKLNRACVFTAQVIFYELIIYIINYDPFPKTGRATAIDWRNFYDNSSKELRDQMREIIDAYPRQLDLSFLYAPCGIEPRDDSKEYSFYEKTWIFIFHNIIFSPCSFKDIRSIKFKSGS